ncbi:hypothetical protein [Telluribacter humicola]|uniref:hypothetical protein n=1 Tax=Telluribacter humicola TaxID=1720261 RepID=UPI001A964B15|nr:hypothetical protein [Telluribacter humicola]
MNLIGRRDFLPLLSLTAAAASLPYHAFASVYKADEYVETEITHGRIRGTRQDGVNIFKGIPYGGRT